MNEQKNEVYFGRGTTFPFGINVIVIPAGDVNHNPFDEILYQTDQNYLHDQFEILSAEQRKLPRIFLKHDPLFSHPTDSKPVVDDPDVYLISPCCVRYGSLDQ